MAWDDTWEKVFTEQEWGKYPGEDIIRFVARNFYKAHHRPDVHLLEIGCGPGANLWFMAREGFTVFGIDGSPTAIQKANTRLDNEVQNWQGQAIVGDMGKLPYEDESMDAVLDIEATSTNSFVNTQAIFIEAARVLKPDGLLYSRMFATGTWGDGSGEKLGENTYLLSDGPMAGKGVTRFTDEAQIELLFPGDMEIISVDLLQWGRGKQTIKEWMVTAKKVR